jgi:hypothetical protein
VIYALHAAKYVDSHAVSSPIREKKKKWDESRWMRGRGEEGTAGDRVQKAQYGDRVLMEL